MHTKRRTASSLSPRKTSTSVDKPSNRAGVAEAAWRQRASCTSGLSAKLAIVPAALTAPGTFNSSSEAWRAVIIPSSPWSRLPDMCLANDPFPELENSPEIWFFIGGGRLTLKLCVVKADCCCANVICGGRAAFRRGLPCVDSSVLMGARREPKTDGGAADPAAAKAGESLMVPICGTTEPKPPDLALDATSTAAEAAGVAA
mmetsp:Transcript_87131/g.141211  ORF Transcript_87131/g.141211 Transcript_87131/m.141211 type:complete len:202 (-) Transcript_87131:504-1109(-)